MDCGKSFKKTQGEIDQFTGRCPSWTAESAKIDRRNGRDDSRLADDLNAARTNQQYIEIGDLNRADTVDHRSIIEFYTRAEFANVSHRPAILFRAFYGVCAESHAEDNGRAVFTKQNALDLGIARL
jgi:hypothetical protein